MMTGIVEEQNKERKRLTQRKRRKERKELNRGYDVGSAADRDGSEN
jgi:hypothetical protein